MGQIGTGRDGLDPGFGVEAETTPAAEADRDGTPPRLRRGDPSSGSPHGSGTARFGWKSTRERRCPIRAERMIAIGRRDEGADRGEKAIHLIASYSGEIRSDPAFFFLNQWFMRSQKRFISLENVLNSLECI